MKNDIEYLNELAWGYRKARVLHAANSLGIFTTLSEGPLTAQQLAQTCRAKPQMLQKLLIACTAMGLLEKTGDSFANTPFADTYLVRGRPLYQGDIIAHSACVWNFWNRLEDEIRIEGPVPPDPARQHRHFIMGMHNIAMLGRAKTMADALDLRGRRRLFDVGGGPGTYSIVLCRKFPQLTAVVFDLPETIAITRQIIAREGMQDRISVREGSWDTHDFGHDNDVVLLSNILHGPESKAEMKLSKAHASMAPGGLLVIQDFVLNDEKSGPLVPALFNIMVGAYSRGELFSLIRQAGFGRPQILVEQAQQGITIITAEKP